MVYHVGMETWKENLIPILGWFISLALVVFCIFVYPGWDTLVDLFEGLIHWARCSIACPLAD